MYIIDSENKKIEVTNLKAAIAQANGYRFLQHTDPTPEIAESDKQRQSYWSDVYTKLLKIQSLITKK